MFSDLHEFGGLDLTIGLDHSGDYGSVYPTYGFIYDRPDHGMMIANTLLNDLAEDCGLKPREFEAEVKAFESKAAAEAPKATPEDRKSPAPEIEARYLAEMQEIDARFNKRVDEILSGSAA